MYFINDLDLYFNMYPTPILVSVTKMYCSHRSLNLFCFLKLVGRYCGRLNI